MLSKKARLLMALFVIVLGAALFGGCSGQESSGGGKDADRRETGDTSVDTGTIVLRVNPEISIQYDQAGRVTQVEGLNEDGHAIVDDNGDYIGKDARKVVKELVEEIHEAGYFVSKTDGSTRNITIQIEPGSVLPQSDYMQVLAEDVQTAVKNANLNSQIVGIGPQDYIEDDGVSTGSGQTQGNQQNNKYISKEKAVEIALAHAGVQKNNARFDDKELDYNNGKARYEIEFTAGGTEYEYDIDAATGKIVSYERDDKDDSKDGSRPANTSAAGKPQQTAPPAGVNSNDDDDDGHDDDRGGHDDDNDDDDDDNDNDDRDDDDDQDGDDNDDRNDD